VSNVSCATHLDSGDLPEDSKIPATHSTDKQNENAGKLLGTVKSQPELDDFTSLRPKVNDQFRRYWLTALK
jgi:hypothetical protein